MAYTPEYVRQRLSEIVDVTERNAFGWEVMDSGRRDVEEYIRQQHPDWTNGEVVVAICRELYKDDFTSEEFDRITDSIQTYHLQNP